MIQLNLILVTIIYLCLVNKFSNGTPVQFVENHRQSEFIILHNNDMHARFEQISKSSGKCLKYEADLKECYGGFARTAHEVRKYRQEAKDGGTPVLYLNAGDTYTGTPWFALFKSNITAAFLNILAPDAMCLGNHEFDEGVMGLIPLLNAVTFPVLASNLNLSKTPELVQTKSLNKSTVLSVLGVKVGIIGYLTPDTKNLARPNDVEFIDEIIAVNQEANKLKADGVNIMIALGHSGYQKDQEIARNCPQIDIVVGGHTNTFLYNGQSPDSEEVNGPYPTIITQPNGKKVPVVQAYAYTKYLGKLHVVFDKLGNLKSWNGQPIIVDATIPEDPDVLELLELYRPNITALENNIIGMTRVPLDGSTCRKTECNLGNIIADSMIYSRSTDVPSMLSWTDASIAIIQGGGIRASISKRPDGSIRMDDIFTVLPFLNELHMVQVNGSTLYRALEHSAAVWETDSNGGFLQVSGLQIVYDMTKPINKRVVTVKVLCARCIVPKYSDLDLMGQYNIILPSFLLSGGDGYNWTETSTVNPMEKSIILKKYDYEVFADYIKTKSPIYPGLEFRIQFSKKLQENEIDKPSSSSRMIGSVFIFLILKYILYILL